MVKELLNIYRRLTRDILLYIREVLDVGLFVRENYSVITFILVKNRLQLSLSAIFRIVANVKPLKSW